MPYMYSDEPVRITFLADVGIVDQIVDWFGEDVRFAKGPDDGKIEATVIASPNAMEHWAMQYIHYVTVLSPQTLVEQIKTRLREAGEKYGI